MALASLFPFTPIPHRANGRYMDPRQLVSLLRKQYGASNFSVDVRAHVYFLIIAPTVLDLLQ